MPSSWERVQLGVQVGGQKPKGRPPFWDGDRPGVFSLPLLMPRGAGHIEVVVSFPFPTPVWLLAAHPSAVCDGGEGRFIEIRKGLSGSCSSLEQATKGQVLDPTLVGEGALKSLLESGHGESSEGQCPDR